LNEIVERASKAYWNAGKTALDWDHESEDQRHAVRTRMRAAIESLRHPSDGMMGYAKHRLPGISRGTAHDVWMLMIDEALAK